MSALLVVLVFRLLVCGIVIDWLPVDCVWLLIWGNWLLIRLTRLKFWLIVLFDYIFPWFDLALFV